MKPNHLQRFTVQGLDQHNREIAIPFALHPRVAWKATGGEIDQSGNFIADRDAKGNFTVTATVGHINGFAKVAVLSVLRRLEISPQKAQLKPEESQTFTITGFDQHGDEIKIGAVNWNTTGDNIYSNGSTFIAGHNAKGNFKVTVNATENNISSSADITVLAVLRRLEIFPANAKIKPDKILDFVARGFDQRGDVINTGKVDWYTTDGSIDQNGTFMAGQNSGQVTIEAYVGSIGCYSHVMVVTPKKDPDPIKPVAYKLLPCDYFESSCSWFCKTQLFYDGYSLNQILDDSRTEEYAEQLFSDYINSSYFKRRSLQYYFFRRS